MPRRPRGFTGNLPYHVMNRAVRRAALFETAGDYEAFEIVLRQALQRVPVRLVAYCAMPNHWHLIVWPAEDGQLQRFMHWLTTTHAQRWHAWHGTSGTGPVYQGRYKAVGIESDAHVLTACRYVERNPIRAGLVTRAEDWRWSSLWRRCNRCADGFLNDWPVPLPSDWLNSVNAS
jgi:REP-associated tyrosine transposase